MKTTLIFVFAALLMVSCENQSQEAAVDTNAEAEKIMALSKEWSTAASEGKDVDKMLSYWADDAVMFSCGEPEVKGKDGLKSMLEESLKIPGFNISWEPVSAKVAQSGDMAYLLEKFKMSMADSAGTVSTVQGNTVTIWHKNADGEWKAAVDISAPLP